MLTGLNLSSLICKFVFYKIEQMQREDPMDLNFEGLEMQK